MPATVAVLSIAPVKGLGLVHPGTVVLDRHGAAGDRRYALVDADGRLVNGKKQGPLVRVRPVASDDPETLVLRLPDGQEVGGEVVLGEPVVGVFYGEQRAGRLVQGEYAEALGALAGVAVRLVRMDDGQGIDRPGDGSVSVQSSSALSALAERAGLDAPVDGRRFRMTFTVDGVDAHAEDGWIGRRVRVGGAVVVPMGNVGRCAITTQDPDTGIRSLDTLRLIKDARGHLPTTEALPFGVHAAVVEPGPVSVGDPVELL